MAAKKAKTAMAIDTSPSPSLHRKRKSLFSRSFGMYFRRTSLGKQHQPRLPDVNDLLSAVDDLRERELVAQNLLMRTSAIVPILEGDIVSKDDEIQRLLKKVVEIEAEKDIIMAEMSDRDAKVMKLESEIDEIRRVSSSQRLVGKSFSFRKAAMAGLKSESIKREEVVPVELERPSNDSDDITGISGSAFSAIVVRPQVPRVPNPPPKRSSSSVTQTLNGGPPPPPPPPPPVKRGPSPPVNCGPPPPPPPPPPVKRGPSPPANCGPPPPPPPPPPVKREPSPPVNCGPPPPSPPPRPPNNMKASRLPPKHVTNKLKRVPEVMEVYHCLTRKESRQDSGPGKAGTTAANAKDLVGELENRSAYLLAIKADVETQRDFIMILIKEVETASFRNIEDVPPFVKWLDDELAYLVDERAVLKHFEWPEKKADALREAAFEYSDLKKLEFEVLGFNKDDDRDTCSSALKKMQTLIEKLEHAAYSLSRLRESTANRFKSFHIPVDWMLDIGFISQIKLASVKLATKYMKRVSQELQIVADFANEEELIVQGVRFAFRVHQFAGGFDEETMRAFEEIREKARSCLIQCQNQQ